MTSSGLWPPLDLSRHSRIALIVSGACIGLIAFLTMLWVTPSVTGAVHGLNSLVRDKLHGTALYLRNESEFSFDFGETYDTTGLDDDAMAAGGNQSEDDYGEADNETSADDSEAIDMERSEDSEEEEQSSAALSPSPITDNDNDDDQDGYSTAGSNATEAADHDGNEVDNSDTDGQEAVMRPPPRSPRPLPTKSRTSRPTRAHPSLSHSPDSTPDATVSPRPSRSASRTPKPSIGDGKPHCGVGQLPSCRAWTWACDMGPATVNAANSTVWEPTGRGGMHRMYIQGRGCDTDALTWRDIGQCLRGKHIMLMGDSITRYQFYNLVQFLELKTWHPRFKPPSEHQKGWRGGYNGLYWGGGATS